MSMPWFKIYDEAQNDPKLETLTDAQHRVWFKLMCFANKQEERGTIPEMKPRLLAIEVARGDVALLNETLDALIELEMLATTEDGGLTWLNWKKRQARRPSDEPEATRQRQATKRARDKETVDDVTPLYKEVTHMSRAVTNSHDTDIDKEEDKEREEAPHSPPRPKAVPKQPEMPPQVQADIALREYVLSKAEGLMSKGTLTRAARDSLKAWFTEHKRGLTSEMVDYAVKETSMHTPGDALAYFCQVLERQLTNGPGTDKRKAGNGGVRGEIPPPGYSWDTLPDGSWRSHEPDPVTGLYAYGYENLDDVLERDKEMQAIHMAKKRGLKVAIMPSGKRIPVPMAGAA